MPVAVTALYAGLLGLLDLGLSFAVVDVRRRARVGIGDGGDPLLGRRIRVHGNFSEYVPFALLLVGMAEANGAPALLVHGLGAALLIGRALHAWGLATSTGSSPGRFAGTVLTWLVLLIASVLAVYQFVAV